MPRVATLRRPRPYLTVSLLAFLILATSPGAAGPLAQEDPSPEAVHHYNRGIALMEQFNPDGALSEFRQVVKLAPNWRPGQINLAIALLNTQKEGDLDECARRLKKLREEAPDEPHVHYSLGMLHLYRGELGPAQQSFEATHRLSPDDPFALYQLGKIAGQDGRRDEAERHLRRALEIQPALASAYYVLGRLALSMKKRDEGRRLLQRFQELENSGTGVKVQIAYGKMGTHADVLRSVRSTVTPPAPTPRPTFQVLPGGLGTELVPFTDTPTAPTGILADLDGDGLSDLVTSSPAGARLFLSGGSTASGYVGADTRLPEGPASAAACADLDGDGDLDLWLAGPGHVTVAFNDGAASFETRDPSTLPLPAGFVPAWIVAADLDLDGDLDGLVGADAAATNGATPTGGVLLLLNRGDGSFAVATAPARFRGVAPSKAGLLSDLDGDGGVDLLVVVDGAPNEIWRNRRLLDFVDVSSRVPLADPGRSAGAISTDLDGDGFPEVILWRGPHGDAVTYRNRGELRFDARPLEVRRSEAAGTHPLAICDGDFDLDGNLDLAVAVGDGEAPADLVVCLGDGRGTLLPFTALSAELPPRPRLLTDDLDRDGSLDLVAIAAGSPPVFIRGRAPAGRHWLRLKLRGVTERNPKSGNRDGVGAVVEVAAGGGRSVREVALGGRSPRPIHFGLGERGKADYVRILWPDGTLQSEMEISGDREVPIDLVKRRSSSCPLLFTWNGDRFEFVTDFIGGGGLGFFSGSGYGAPDPSEDVRIPPGALVQNGDVLRLRILEPLEEVCYLDRVELLAVDHPAGHEIYPEERFGGQAPTGTFLEVTEEIAPTRARWCHATSPDGVDVADLVAAADGRTPQPPLEPRFAGFAREHSLELGVPKSLAAADGEVFLIVDGWIEYSYSHLVYAAAQSGLFLSPPALDVPDGHGGWRTLIADTGYPAGLPRITVIPVPREAAAAGRFRLRTNLEIYWDHVFFAVKPPAPASTIHELAPSLARLGEYGTPLEVLPEGGGPPAYDYHRRASGVHFRAIPGLYTRYGPVDELLEATDDRFVIFGRGDELAVEFPASTLPPVAPGHRRTFVLRAHGYCKDRNPHTAHPDGVEPLPFRAMSGYPYGPAEQYPTDPEHVRYRELWNTRRIHDR